MKELSNEGIKFYIDLITKTDADSESKYKLKSIQKTMLFWEKILNAFRRRTYLCIMIEFAIERDWIDFTVKHFEDWLSIKNKTSQNIDYNIVAHSIMQSCGRIPAPITVYQEQTPDGFSVKKHYKFDRKFKTNLQLFFNNLIQNQDQWQQEKEKNLQKLPIEHI